MSTLEEATTDELWAELSARFRHAVLVTVREDDGGELCTDVYYHGGQAACVGLAEVAKATMIRDELDALDGGGDG